ncbi:MAG TPA: FlgO family outer membrane protein [Burkholderiaceae bacterium]|nr:FlgO family outer membrane protein [Burkholderiaceae bacterium]
MNRGSTLRRVAAGVALGLALTGCHHLRPPHGSMATGLAPGFAAEAGGAAHPADTDAIDDPLTRANYEAADRLLATDATQPEVLGTVVVATVVSQDDLDRSTALGRLVSEQVAGRLAQRGLAVREVKLRGSLFVARATGALMLSRELSEIARSHDAEAAVVGTSARGAQGTWVSLKLVRLADARVLAGWDYLLGVDDSLGQSPANTAPPLTLYDAVRAYGASRAR